MLTYAVSVCIGMHANVCCICLLTSLACRLSFATATPATRGTRTSAGRSGGSVQPGSGMIAADIPQATCEGIRQHTSAYVSICQHTSGMIAADIPQVTYYLRGHMYVSSVSIRQHTSAYVRLISHRPIRTYVYIYTYIYVYIHIYIYIS
jgi:hypothetical protein